MPKNFTDLRNVFPITAQKIFLDNAAHSPLNLLSRKAMEEYLDYLQDDTNARPEFRISVKRKLAKLLGGSEAEFALTTSTSHGINLIANGLELQPGDNVIISQGEHWSSCYPWFNLRDRGVEVRVVQPDKSNRIMPNMLAEVCDHNTRVMCVTAVRFDTGFRYDLRSISKIAHENDALLVVDGIQCAGAMQMNVETDGIDILACGGFKWLLGATGTGFLYINDNARKRIRPTAPGMFAARKSFDEILFHDSSQKFETGTISNIALAGWGAGLDLLLDVGVDNIEQQNLCLTDQLLQGLKNLPVKIITPHSSPLERSAIVSISFDQRINLDKLVNNLAAEQIYVTQRGPIMRISPNFYNTSEEIDKLLVSLAANLSDRVNVVT